MAQEVSRTFDTNMAAVIVIIRDEFGNTSPHTIHLCNVSTCAGCGNRSVIDVSGNVDVEGTVTQIIADVDAGTAKIRARMIAAGWTPS